MLDATPAVELAFASLVVLNRTLKEQFLANSSTWKSTWDATAAQNYAEFMQWSSVILAVGALGVLGRLVCCAMLAGPCHAGQGRGNACPFGLAAFIYGACGP